MKQLRYAEHDITIKDTLAVVKALRTGDIASGAVVREFEKAVEKRLGGSPIKAIAVSSGTAALHLAVIAARRYSYESVITSPNSFVASANCAQYYEDNSVDFADIDFATGCIDVKDAVRKCAEQGASILIPVDYAGVASEVHLLRKSIPEDTIIILDACHSFGGLYLDREFPSRLPLTTQVGASYYADMTVFSFHASKVITTGEGGMIVTRNEKYAEKLRELRSHGMHYGKMTQLGFNYRMTDIQAALGLSQLKRLDEIRRHRAKLVQYYYESLRDLKHVQMIQPYSLQDRQTLCWHLMPIRVQWEAYGTDRDRVRQGLLNHDIGTQIHYYPIPMQPYYCHSYETAKELWPNAVRHWEQELTLPLHTRMGIREAEQVVYHLRKELGV